MKKYKLILIKILLTIYLYVKYKYVTKRNKLFDI